MSPPTNGMLQTLRAAADVERLGSRGGAFVDPSNWSSKDSDR